MPDCRTRYPILLIHGLNCRDDWIFSYWGPVTELLRARGAQVYLSGQDAWGAVPRNAWALSADECNASWLFAVLVMARVGFYHFAG